MVKFCPRCGARAIPGAKYCRSCGNKLEKEKKQEVVEEQENFEVEEEESKTEPQKKIKRQKPEKIELTEEEEESLLIVSKIIPIQKKVEELKKEKDNLEIKFRVEETITEKEYNAELKKLDAEIDKLEKEIESKKKDLSSVALLNLVDEVVEMRERQEKLEEIFKEGRIQESTYERLKREYQDKEEKTEEKVDEEEHRLKLYRDNLEYEKEEIASQKEEYFARHQVGEFTEKEYRQKIKELEAKDIDGLIAAIDEVLARMARV